MIPLFAQSIVFAEPDAPAASSLVASPLVAMAVGGFFVVAIFALLVVVVRRLRPKRVPQTMPAGFGMGMGFHPGYDRMSPQELQLYAMSGGARAAVPTPVATPPLPRIRPADGAGSGAPFTGLVYCPACTAQLAAAGPTLEYVTRCPGCARWLSARVAGSRLTIEVREG
jgi:hypothetical protein